MNTLQNSARVKLRPLLVEVPIEEDEQKENSIEVDVHQQDSDASVKDREFNGCIRSLILTDLTPTYDSSFRSS